MVSDKYQAQQSLIHDVSSRFNIKIGDIVPYTNTRSNIKHATITEFVKTEAKNPIWFRGIDTITKAKVWYSLHISLELQQNGY